MIVYTIRIVYTSGYTQDFDVTEFAIKDGSYTWKSYEPQDRRHHVTPLLLGAAHIAAVWQVGMRNE
jgi:hypothetical protein